MTENNQSLNTYAVHAMKAAAGDGSFNVGIVPNSTFAQTEAGEWDDFTYGRTNTPTEQALRETLANLENGKRAVCFSSGIAAIAGVTELLEPGDAIVVMSDIYGGTYRFFEQFAGKRGINVRFVDLSADEVSADQLSGAKMIFAETPSNPRLLILNIEALANSAHDAGALLVVDNTMATPVNQRPLDLGADIVIHSTSKYLSGHTNVVGGAAITNDDALADKLHFIRKSTGANPSPFDCYLVMLGIKTLGVRMERHASNAAAVYNHCLTQERITSATYVGAAEHPQAELIERQMLGSPGIVSLYMNSADCALAFTNGLELFSTAVSFGSVASLVEYPIKMSHKDIPHGAGAPAELVRLSVGIEDIDDLIADIDQALDRI